MMAAALQIPYTEEDFKIYREWTKRHDVRRIAFANALYRVKTGGHIQAVVSGEYNHGKSTTAMLLTKWDTFHTGGEAVAWKYICLPDLLDLLLLNF